MRNMVRVAVIGTLLMAAALSASNLTDDGSPWVPGPVVATPKTQDSLEYFGSTAYTYGPGGSRGRGNIFRCDVSSILREQRVYLNPTTSDTMIFTVYESRTDSLGTYDLIDSVTIPAAGSGAGWYSSGTRSVPLQAGKYYAVVPFWKASATYYNQQSIVPYPIPANFGAHIGQIGLGAGLPYANPPLDTAAILAAMFSLDAAYYVSLVTYQAPTVTWTYPADGDLNAHVDPCVKIAFSEPMNTSSFGYACNPSLGAVNGITWNATNDTLTINLVNNKAYSTSYTLNYWCEDAYGHPLGAGAVPQPIHFTTWHAPEVIRDQLATTGNGYVCQVFGDVSTYSTYLADDIDLTGMDSVTVSAIEIYGDYWTGHSGHRLDSLYVGFTTDSTDLPAWSQAVFQRNIPAGSFDDVPISGTRNAYIMYLDPPAVLHNGKNWMVFAPFMNYAAKDGQWGWCQNNPPAVTHGSGPAARNPGNGFGYGGDWQRASTWPGMTGDGVFRALGRTFPTPHAFGTIDTTITFTTPPSNTLAGITFCPADSDFYFVSMADDSVYRLDPETWALSAAFATDNPAGGIPWGISWDGTHFWVSHVEGSNCINKQYTFAGTYTGEYFDVTGVGGSTWMGGMDFDGTYTWQTAVGGSNKLYRLDLANDTVVDSIPGVPWVTSQRGCSWIPWTSQFLSGGWNTGLIYLLDDQGNQLSTASLGSVADLDIYDFIAEGHELWALVSINTSPNTIHKVWLGVTRPLGVEGKPAALPAPKAIISLMPNYPNPVRANTTIEFSLPKADRASLKVYNLLGQTVATLVDGQLPAGNHRATWNARGVANGIYLYQLTAGGRNVTRKLVVVK